MDYVEQEALRRIYQADTHRRESGYDAERFHLVYTGGGRILQHPGWDPLGTRHRSTRSMMLGDSGFVRLDAVVPVGSKQRSFVITSAGRTEGDILHDKRGIPTAVGGWAPPLPTALAWVLSVFSDAPECLSRQAVY